MSSAKLDGSKKQGKVHLVGAGPGDHELLTLKALRIIQSSDVVLYDKLVSEEILALIPSGTKKFFVGKSKNKHSVPQQQLNNLLVTLAQKGLSICRLKGGDPFVFGRGSEEMLTLHQHSIEAEIVPGITAASGCTSYAGIPLTHRGLSQGCTFITGHAEKNLDINWKSLAELKQTLVLYMGLTQLQSIQTQLIKYGLSPQTPAALIENGCRTNQRVLTTELSKLADVAMNNQLKSPTLIVIGDVVNLHSQLDWFMNNNFENSDLASYTKKIYSTNSPVELRHLVG